MEGAWARELVERAPIGIFRTTRDGRFRYANPAFARMLGYASVAEVLLLDAPQVYFEAADREYLLQEYRRRRDLQGYDLRVRRKDGSPLWVRIDMQSVPGEAPGSLELEGFVHDISESRRAEEELRKLSRAVEHSPASVVITDLKGNIEYVNPKFTRITGYSREEAIGQNPRILKSGEAPPEAYAALWDAITHGREWYGEFHNKRKDGTLFWEFASISPVVDAEGRTTHFVGIKEDITARKEAEAQLRQAQKMQAVGRLAGGVAHDFNNLLTAILGYTELLLQDVGPNDPKAAELNEILAAAQRAAALTRQLLTFSRKQVEQVEVVDVAATIHGMERMLRHMIGEDVLCVCTVPADLWRVRADRSQIEQVLLNLVVNARDAMPKGGTLRVEAANVTRAGADRGAGAGSRDGSWVVLSVTDDGVGMSAETLRHVFEPFFTTKPRGKGTGLGLATVYGIVHQAGGFTEVASEPGKGATFRIFLPRAEKEPPQARRTSGVGRLSIPRGNETILLVEDEELVRKLASDVLRGRGYTVLAAASGREALALAETDGQAIRLVVTDVVMPEMSGPEMAGHLAARGFAFPVLYVSGYADSDSGGVLPGGAPLLQKPFSPDALARRVRELLDEAAG